MAKPTLYWAVKRETYGSRYTYMRVTSERDRQVFGSEHGVPTHCKRGEILGKHETEEAAQACIEAVQKVREAWQPRLDEARHALGDVERDRDLAILRAAQGV